VTRSPSGEPTWEKHQFFVKTTHPVNQSCVGNKPRTRLARCHETGMSWNVSNARASIGQSTDRSVP